MVRNNPSLMSGSSAVFRAQLVEARLEEQALVLLLGEPQSAPLGLGYEHELTTL